MDLSDELQQTVSLLLLPGMGLLAADESLGTIERRFAAVGVESTPESRRAYRELLLTAPGIGEQISGVILYDETIRDRASDGTPFPELVRRRGAVPGVKVDLGAKPLAFAPDESVTEGLDGLRERLQEYKALGARFTKWRAVLKIGPGIPSDYCLAVNAHALARFAVLSQEAGLVPIVERRPSARAGLRSYPGFSASALRRAGRPAGRPGAHAAQTQHGARWAGQR